MSENSKEFELGKKIVAHMVRTAIDLGYVVSVSDGEEWTVKKSASIGDIMAAVGTTDMDNIRFRIPGTETVIGTVAVICGNGTDVIVDHTTKPEMEALMLVVSDYAEKLET